MDDIVLSLTQQLIQVLGLGSGSTVADIFACFFLLCLTLLSFNLIFLFVGLFFKRRD